MKNTGSFLRRVSFSDPHLWLAFVAAAISMLWYFLYKFKLTQGEVSLEGYVFVITLGIFALVLERLREGEQLKENTNKLNSIYNSLFDKRASLCRRPSPSQPEAYAYLWGGYTGTYFAYNPSYKVDEFANEEKIVSFFIDRYQDPSFKEARYLFLTGDASGKADLEFFRRLMNRVKKKYPNIVNKIKVKEMKDKKASSEPEMYLGTRFGKQRGVIELKEPTAPQHGRPNYYLVIDDEDVVRHFLEKHFEQEWGKENAEGKGDFWDS
ncbi:MAG: hypothetical protein M3416_04805 [Acidobacteriota bacterium]|nr:hypothetical protein [Acidobacteriota bacterium]